MAVVFITFGEPDPVVGNPQAGYEISREMTI
jgi:hypothetical protein